MYFSNCQLGPVCTSVAFLQPEAKKRTASAIAARTSKSVLLIGPDIGWRATAVLLNNDDDGRTAVVVAVMAWQHRVSLFPVTAGNFFRSHCTVGGSQSI